MIILVHGKDSFQVKEKVKELSQGKNVFWLENLSQLKQEINQETIFQEKKTLILCDLWKLVEKEEKIILNLKNSDKTTIIFKEEKVDKKTETFFKKNGQVFFFDLMKLEEVKKWINSRTKGKFDNEAVSLLADLVGNDLWQCSNEIAKLLSYNQNKITKKDVNLLVPARIEGDIFKAIDYLASKKIKEALELFYKHLRKKDHPLYLLTMVNYQFRNLMLVKFSPNKNSKELNLHPFVFQKSLRMAQLFSEEEIKKIHSKILKTEVDIKTGKLTAEDAFNSLILEISSS